jgi:hypothetical protein
MPKKQHTKEYSKVFYKEVIFSILAVLSLLLLAYEFFFHPSSEVIKIISRFDFVVALLFLTDFCVQLYKAKHKGTFMRHNWYLLLASIPLVDGWAEVLRGLRILSLVRLVRASEHLHYATEAAKPKSRR